MEEEEKKAHRDIIADMVRQYKSTEEELTTLKSALEQRISDNKFEIDLNEKKLEEQKAQAAEELNKKDEVIKTLT